MRAYLSAIAYIVYICEMGTVLLTAMCLLSRELMILQVQYIYMATGDHIYLIGKNKNCKLILIA